MSDSAAPSGYPTVTPYLIVEDADGLLDFMKEALGGTERTRMAAPGGGIGHAEVMLGESLVMVASATDESGPNRNTIHLYVSDCDATYEAALHHGAKSLREPTTEFYGDRMAGVEDASGTTWWLATRVETLSPEEMQRRSEEWASTQPS